MLAFFLLLLNLVKWPPSVFAVSSTNTAGTRDGMGDFGIEVGQRKGDVKEEREKQ